MFYLFSGNMNLLSDGFNGSTLKNLSKSYLQNIKLPIVNSSNNNCDFPNRTVTPVIFINTKHFKNLFLIIINL